MKQEYVHNFILFLESKGYDAKYIAELPIKSRQLDFSGVAIKDKVGPNGKIIQAFALMSDSTRCLHHLYPFYRTMHWENNGNIYPSCSVACLDKKGDWKIYDANDTRRDRPDEYLNYENALSRFKSRINAAPARELNQKAKITSWVLAGVFLCYLIARIAFPHLDLPLDANMVTFSIVISALILLPTVLPLIKSISFFGIDLIIGNE